MNVLIGCERSGVVRDAFLRRGHDAWSCDLVDTEVPGPHIKGDVRWVLRRGWDCAILHPDCTYLSVSGLHWNKRRPERKALTEDALEFVGSLMINATECCGRWALENPIGCISTRIQKPDQIIQPWQFGEDASKATCLWLRGLPKLTPTKIVPPNGWKTVKFTADMFCPETDEAPCLDCGVDFADCSCPGPTQDGMEYAEVFGVMFAREEGRKGKPVWANQTPSGQNKLGPSPERAMLRAKTYLGIADAMAEQWGTLTGKAK